LGRFEKGNTIKPVRILFPDTKRRNTNSVIHGIEGSGTSELIIDTVCKEKSIGDADIKLLVMVVDMYPLIEI
jgi:hypothetical protein